MTFAKIIAGEYVDFLKLIAKDRLLQEDDQRLEVVMWGGKTF